MIVDKDMKIEKSKEYLTGFLQEFGYVDEARRALQEAFDRFFADTDGVRLFADLRAHYEADPNAKFAFMIERAKGIAEKAGISPYTAYLLLLILLSESSKSVYAAQGLSAEMWRSNMLDLKYWCDHCRLVKGVYGTAWIDWPQRFFAATRFGFGKLQFETDRLGKRYEKDGVKIEADDKVIFIHIPRTGERLTPKDVDEACAEASEFYKQRYGVERVVFACHSWILYPENKKILSETSNLYSFISRFEIIDVVEDTSYKDLWRLFDMDYRGDADALPQDTSLRRAYAQRVKEHKPLGVALGVWVYRQ